MIKAVSLQNGTEFDDMATFNKVLEPNISYEAIVEGKGGAAANWFTIPDFSNVEIEEIEITDDVYSTRCTFGEIMKNGEAADVIRKYLAKFVDNPFFSMNHMMSV